TLQNLNTWVSWLPQAASVESSHNNKGLRLTSSMEGYRAVCQRRHHFLCSESYRRPCRMPRSIVVYATSKFTFMERPRKLNCRFVIMDSGLTSSTPRAITDLA